MKKHLLATAATFASFSAAHAQDADVDWSGFYAGLHGGYAAIDDNLTGVTFAFMRPASGDPQAMVGGGQAGLNFQTGNMVFGFEADISAGNFNNDQDIVLFGKGVNAGHAQHDWFSTSRVRVGLTGGRTMAYVTGGVALLDTDMQFYDSGPGVSGGTGHDIQSGPVFGVGVEHRMTDRFSAKAEYLHAEFGKETFNVPGVSNRSISDKPSLDVFRVGLNYQF
jgi:outer membrane immunogenic protein